MGWDELGPTSSTAAPLSGGVARGWDALPDGGHVTTKPQWDSLASQGPMMGPMTGGDPVSMAMDQLDAFAVDKFTFGGRPEPPRETATDLGMLGHNTVKDMQTLGHGIGLSGTIGGGRFRESFIPRRMPSFEKPFKSDYDKPYEALGPLEYALNPLKNFGNKPVFRPFPLSPNEPSDIQSMAAMVQDVGQRYNERYIKRGWKALKGAATGHPEAVGQEWHNLSKDFGKEPLMTVADVGPLRSMAGTGTRLTGKAAMGTLKRVAPGAARDLRVAGDVAQIIGSGLVREVLGNITGSGRYQDVQAAIRYARAESQAFRKSADAVKTEVWAAWSKVPGDLQKIMVDAGEQTDWHAVQAVMANKEASDFLKLAQRYNEEGAQALKGQVLRFGDGSQSRPLMTGIEERVAKFGPAVRRLFGQDEKWLWSKDGQKAIADYEASLKQAGIPEPTYFARQAEVYVNNAMKALGRKPFGGLPSSPHKVAQGAESLDVEFPHWMKVRNKGIRQPFMANHAAQLVVYQSTRVMQFVHLKKTLDKFAQMAQGYKVKYKFDRKGQFIGTEIIGQKLNGHRMVDATKLVAGVMKATGASDDAIRGILEAKDASGNPLLNTQFMLPNAQAEKLEELFGGGSRIRGAAWWRHGVEAPNNIMKFWTLLMDAFWPISQGLQNQTVLGNAMFRGPGDIVPSLVAYALGMDQKLAKKIFPGNVIYTDSPHLSAASSTGTIVEELAHIAAKPLTKFSETVAKGATFTDNQARATMGFYGLIQEMKNAGPAERKMVNQALLNVRQFKLEAEKFGAANPKVTEAAAKRVDQWCGDYSPEMAAATTWQRATLPFYLWYCHALSIYKRMMLETPYKASLMHNFARVAPKLYVPDQLASIYREQGYIFVMGEDGKPVKRGGYYEVFGMPALTPLQTAPELMGQMGSFFDTGVDSEGLPFAHVYISYLLMQGLGQNPTSLRAYSDKYNLVPGPNGQYDPRKLAAIMASGDLSNLRDAKVSRVTPDPLGSALKVLAPKQVSGFNAITQREGMPSPVSTPWRPSYGIGGKGDYPGQKLPPEDAGQTMLRLAKMPTSLMKFTPQDEKAMGVREFQKTVQGMGYSGWAPTEDGNIKRLSDADYQSSIMRLNQVFKAP